MAAAAGRTGGGWYGPTAPASVTVGGHNVANSALVTIIMMSDLGGDIEWGWGDVMSRQLTTQLSGTAGGKKVGDTVSWEEPQFYFATDGSKLTDDDLTPYYSNRHQLHLIHQHKVGWELNAYVKKQYFTDPELRRKARSAVLPLADKFVMNVTRLCVGDYTFSRQGTVNSTTRLTDPGEIEETNLASVRDGAKAFSNLTTSMRARRVLEGGRSLTALLNIYHAEHMALETLGIFNPSEVVDQMFRDPRAKGKMYGSRVQSMVRLSGQQIGSLDGTGPITLKTAPTEGSDTVVLTGFGANKTGVIYAGVCLAFKNCKAVDPQGKDVLKDTFQTVIKPTVDTGNSYDGVPYKGYQRAFNSDASGDVTLKLSKKLYWSQTGDNRMKRNISQQPTAGSNVSINGIEIAATAQRTLFAGKTQTMSHFYATRAIQCVMIPFDEEDVGAGVNVIATNSPTRKLAMQTATAGNVNTLNRRSRVDLGVYGMELDREDSAARLGGEAA